MNRGLYLAFTVIFWGALSLSAIENQDAGFVLQSSGDWYLQSNPTDKVVTGQSLPAGGVLRLKHARLGNAITIVLLNGNTIERFCTQSLECVQPVELPRTLRKTSSVFDRILLAVRGVLGIKPEQYKPMISRSGEPIQEAVLKLHDQTVDFNPLLKQTTLKVYRIVVRPVMEKQEMKSMEYVWNPSIELVTRVGDLAPGLYTVSIGSGGNSASAWCIIASDGDYQKKANSFQQAVQLTQSWKDSTSTTTRTFLRAYLKYLSESSAS
jgi:hypothetical protein